MDFSFYEDKETNVKDDKNSISGEYYNESNDNNNEDVSTVSTDELEKNILMEKYDNLTYSETDRVNLIKKIEIYLTDPDLKKISNSKYHLHEYIGTQQNRKNLNNLDAKTLNYIYDELRDLSMSQGINDMAFKGYLTCNEIIETLMVKSNVDVEGYAHRLDNPMNKLLMKQITVDNFNYMSGRINPQYLLLFNTLNTMTATYSINKRKTAKVNNTPPQQSQPPKPQPSQPPQPQQQEQKNEMPQIKPELQKFIKNNSIQV